MKRKSFLTTILIITVSSLLFCGIYVGSISGNDYSVLNISDVFIEKDLKINDETINIWGSKTFPSDTPKESIALDVKEKLSIIHDYTSEDRSDSKIDKYCLFGDIQTSNLLVPVKVIVGSYTDSPDNIIISITFTNNIDGEWKKEVASSALQMFNSWNMKNNLNFSVRSMIRGEFDYSVIEKVYSDMFSSLNATEVERIEEDGFISICAYTPDISSTLMSNNKKINLNFSARYIPSEKYTNIWLASPIILQEY